MQPVSQPAAAWSRGVYRLGGRPEQAEFGAGGSGVGLRAARREAVLERVGEGNAEHRALGVGARSPSRRCTPRLRSNRARRSRSVSLACSGRSLRPAPAPSHRQARASRHRCARRGFRRGTRLKRALPQPELRSAKRGLASHRPALKRELPAHALATLSVTWRSSPTVADGRAADCALRSPVRGRARCESRCDDTLHGSLAPPGGAVAFVARTRLASPFARLR